MREFLLRPTTRAGQTPAAGTPPSPHRPSSWPQAIAEEVLDRARELELFQLCPRAGALNVEEVARGCIAAPEIRVWGIAGTPQEVRAMVLQAVESGCDGMTINWPDWVKG